MKGILMFIFMIVTCNMFANNHDTISNKIIRHNIIKHDSVIFVDTVRYSNKNYIKTTKTLQSTTIDVSIYKGYITLETGDVDGYYAFTSTKIDNNGDTIYKIEDGDVLIITIKKNNEIVFLRSSGELMILR